MTELTGISFNDLCVLDTCSYARKREGYQVHMFKETERILLHKNEHEH